MEELEYIDVRKKVKELALNEINGLTFLPYNFEVANDANDFVYDDSLKVVSKLFKNENIAIDRLEKNISNTKFYQENDITWIGPTIFVAYSFWEKNPDLMTISLSLIANYLTDFFKGKTQSPIIKLEYVIEKNPDTGEKSIKLIYQGDIEGLSELPAILKNIKDE